VFGCFFKENGIKGYKKKQLSYVYNIGFQNSNTEFTDSAKDDVHWLPLISLLGKPISSTGISERMIRL